MYFIKMCTNEKKIYVFGREGVYGPIYIFIIIFRFAKQILKNGSVYV